MLAGSSSVLGYKYQGRSSLHSLCLQHASGEVCKKAEKKLSSDCKGFISAFGEFTDDDDVADCLKGLKRLIKAVKSKSKSKHRKKTKRRKKRKVITVPYSSRKKSSGTKYKGSRNATITKDREGRICIGRYLIGRTRIRVSRVQFNHIRDWMITMVRERRVKHRNFIEGLAPDVKNFFKDSNISYAKLRVEEYFEVVGSSDTNNCGDGTTHSKCNYNIAYGRGGNIRRQLSRIMKKVNRKLPGKNVTLAKATGIAQETKDGDRHVYIILRSRLIGLDVLNHKLVKAIILALGKTNLKVEVNIKNIAKNAAAIAKNKEAIDGNKADADAKVAANERRIKVLEDADVDRKKKQHARDHRAYFELAPLGFNGWFRYNDGKGKGAEFAKDRFDATFMLRLGFDLFYSIPTKDGKAWAVFVFAQFEMGYIARSGRTLKQTIPLAYGGGMGYRSHLNHSLAWSIGLGFLIEETAINLDAFRQDDARSQPSLFASTSMYWKPWKKLPISLFVRLQLRHMRLYRYFKPDGEDAKIRVADALGWNFYLGPVFRF